MLSDAQKKDITHAAEVLRASANVIADVHDEASPAIVAAIVDARDTADKLDAMVVQKSTARLDDTKPQGLTKRTPPHFGDDETEMA